MYFSQKLSRAQKLFKTNNPQVFPANNPADFPVEAISDFSARVGVGKQYCFFRIEGETSPEPMPEPYAEPMPEPQGETSVAQPMIPQFTAQVISLV